MPILPHANADTTICPRCARETDTVGRNPEGAQDHKQRNVLIAVCVVLGCVIVALLGAQWPTPQPQQSGRSSPVLEPASPKRAAPAAVPAEQWQASPPDQARLIEIVEQARHAYNAGSNDMAKGASFLALVPMRATQHEFRLQ